MNGVTDGGISVGGRPAKLVPVMFPVAEMVATPDADTPIRPKSPELTKVKLPLLAEPRRDLTVLLRSSLTSVPLAKRTSVVSAAVWVTAPPETISINPPPVRVALPPSSPPYALIAPPSEILPGADITTSPPEPPRPIVLPVGAVPPFPPIAEMAPMDPAPPGVTTPPPPPLPPELAAPPLPPAPPSARTAPTTVRDCPPWRSTNPALPPAPPPLPGPEVPGPAPPSPPLTSMAPLALPTETLPLASRLTLPPCPPSAPVKAPLLLAALPPRALIPPPTRMSPRIMVVVRPLMKTSPADPPE